MNILKLIALAAFFLNPAVTIAQTFGATKAGLVQIDVLPVSARQIRFTYAVEHSHTTDTITIPLSQIDLRMPDVNVADHAKRRKQSFGVRYGVFENQRVSIEIGLDLTFASGARTASASGMGRTFLLGQMSVTNDPYAASAHVSMSYAINQNFALTGRYQYNVQVQDTVFGHQGQQSITAGLVYIPTASQWGLYVTQQQGLRYNNYFDDNSFGRTTIGALYAVNDNLVFDAHAYREDYMEGGVSGVGAGLSYTTRSKTVFRAEAFAGQSTFANGLVTSDESGVRFSLSRSF